MKLILLCTTMVLLMSSVQVQKSQSERRRRDSIARIYMRANVSVVPDSILSVSFAACNASVNVTLGMEISPLEARNPPTIDFDCESGNLYTFICKSSDWPSPQDPYLSDSLLALYANLKCTSEGIMLTEASCEVASWRGPIPIPGTGPHRYELNVFEQNGYIDTTDEALQSLQLNRVLFSLSNFVRRYNLVSPPVAGTLIYSTYPVNCNDSQN